MTSFLAIDLPAQNNNFKGVYEAKLKKITSSDNNTLISFSDNLDTAYYFKGMPKQVSNQGKSIINTINSVDIMPDEAIINLTDKEITISYKNEPRLDVISIDSITTVANGIVIETSDQKFILTENDNKLTLQVNAHTYFLNKIK